MNSRKTSRYAGGRIGVIAKRNTFSRLAKGVQQRSDSETTPTNRRAGNEIHQSFRYIGTRRRWLFLFRFQTKPQRELRFENLRPILTFQ